MLGETLGMILAIPLTIYAFLSVPLYPVAQVVVVILRRGPVMWLALLPIAPMAYSYMVFNEYWQRGGNLSPLILLFSSSLALTWIFLTGWFARPRDFNAILDRWWPRWWD